MSAEKSASRLAAPTAERIRLSESRSRGANWKRWGPYLPERQWGTVREDYSPDGSAWSYLPHDHARSRAYRWGEDGLLGFTDRQCRICFSVALWNEKDPILKERLFGLTNDEGNHGEDVKEAYFYLDATPTYSYVKSLYKYPQARFPYERLVEENARRGHHEREFEIEDTGVFDQGRYFDVFAEFAKNSAEDVLIRLTVWNRGPEPARLHVLPTLWFRNLWTWGCTHEGCGQRPRLELRLDGVVFVDHPELGAYLFAADGDDGAEPEVLFTENETNVPRLFGAPGASPWFKDAFHAYVVDGLKDAVRPDGQGSKCAFLRRLEIPAGGAAELRLRFVAVRDVPAKLFDSRFDEVFANRRREADEFYATVVPAEATPDERVIARQAYAGLCFSQQFYEYIVEDWLRGDRDQPPPPASRRRGRNHAWRHLYNHDVISVPDKWEYPWYAVWDLAFHMVSLARIDPDLAKAQLLLFLREWYMHPNGKLPSYEWAFSDANPPVHAWAVWRVYKLTAPHGARDLKFLERAFQKLLLNFTWWVNRADVGGRQIFAGGFLGLDNVGVFDRNKPLPSGVVMAQADGTAWMAFYAGTMLSIALELAKHSPVYEDMASKFFEHFVAIADTMNHLGGEGLWDEVDGFYYDKMRAPGVVTLRARSIVGLIPLIAAEIIDAEHMDRFPEFAKRTRWFLTNRSETMTQIAGLERSADGRRILLALASRPRLERLLKRLFDEDEFLSPHGIRSLSRYHAERPFELDLAGEHHSMRYEPAESVTTLFGGNSNWRGPVWFPLNHLIVEALQRYDHFYGDSMSVELPTGSGRRVSLESGAAEIDRRLTSLFVPNAQGARPCVGDHRFASDPHWRDHVPFHEYFHGDTGRGLGASHQTGWTALVTRSIESVARRRRAALGG